MMPLKSLALVAGLFGAAAAGDLSASSLGGIDSLRVGRVGAEFDHGLSIMGPEEPTWWHPPIRHQKRAGQGSCRMPSFLRRCVRVRALEDATISSEIGPEGGDLTTTVLGHAYSLSLPANALLDPEIIALTPILSVRPLPLAFGFAAGARLGPDGLALFDPARLTIPLRRFGRGVIPVGFMSDNEGGGFHLVPLTINGNTAQLELWHFSIAGVGLASCADLELLPDAVGLNPREEFEEEAAKIDLRKECDDEYRDSDEQIIDDLTAALTDQMLGNQGLLDRLKSVFDLEEFKALLSELAQWEENWLTIGGELADPILEEAFKQVNEAFSRNIAELSKLLCEEGDDSAEDRINEWLSFVELLNQTSLFSGSMIDIDSLLELKECGIASIELFHRAKRCFLVRQLTLKLWPMTNKAT